VALRAAYAALSLGLMGAGALLIWLALRRPSRPAGTGVRALLTLAALSGLAGAVIAVILEARAARPW
jgi:hypothetical protein